MNIGRGVEAEAGLLQVVPPFFSVKHLDLFKVNCSHFPLPIKGLNPCSATYCPPLV